MVHPEPPALKALLPGPARLWQRQWFIIIIITTITLHNEVFLRGPPEVDLLSWTRALALASAGWVLVQSGVIECAAGKLENMAKQTGREMAVIL